MFRHDRTLRTTSTAIPGWCSSTAGAGRQPGLVQGGLAAREDARARTARTSGRSRTTCRSTRRGTTRGIHAEPWDKYVSVATGRVFGAWVDLREGPTFGAAFTAELDPGRAVFVPRGVGNSYQTLEDDTAYTYLVNEHWSPDAEYTFLNLADETRAIAWPIPLAQAEISAKDLAHPRLADVVPMKPRNTLVVGGNGQLGRALREVFPDAEFTTRADSTSPIRPRAPRAVERLRRDHQRRGVHRGRHGGDARGARDAWAVNVTAVGRARPDRDRERHHARARLERLRLRRHGRGAPRGRAAQPARRLRPDEGRRRRARVDGPAATTSCAPAG